jgi:hypothetical protein
MPPTPLGNLDLLRLENLDTAGRPPAIAREIVHAAVEDDVVLPDGAVAGGQRAGGAVARVRAAPPRGPLSSRRQVAERPGQPGSGITAITTGWAASCS